MYITEWALKSTACFGWAFFYLVQFINSIKLLINWELFENHVIVGEGAGFIAQQIFDSAKFLRDSAVSTNRTRNQLIVCNFIGKVGFTEIQIDSQRNRNDTREKENISEEVKRPQDINLSEHIHNEG